MAQAADATAAIEAECGVGRAIAVEANVRDVSLIEQALSKTVTAFGRLDTVIANAGVRQEPVPFVDLPVERWHEVLAVNLTGAFLTLQAGARALIAQGTGGSLIAIGSSMAIRSHGAQMIGYVAAKGGVHTMIRGLAFELAAHRIRVNAIAPGLTDTPMTRANPGYIEQALELVPLKEAVQPEELAALAAFMVSDEARHMTGSIVQLDAGRTSD
jgi:NAD(P)-dependent dehydrogenase (short-subunit alcohol dehydrogenase family)